MMLYPYHWRFKGGKNINKVKQFYTDLFSSESEKYWSDEGNNQRMRKYHKISIGLKICKTILMMVLIIYCLILSTNSMFCLFDKVNCCNNTVTLESIIDLKKYVYNTYVITFIMALFVILYNCKKNKYQLKKIISLIIDSLLFLPVSALLTYNFMFMGSLMSSFYLVVVVTVLMYAIDYLVKRIDSLFELAVGSKELNKKGKGENKICKKK